jgi:hypothetical protein
MLSFPKSKEFIRRISKQKFYDKLLVTPGLKRAFIEQISVIYWRNKLATTTLNVGQGERVTELEIFEIKLNQPSLDSKILQLIDKEIPYHILFLLEHNGEYQAWIGYKESSLAKTVIFKVNNYYHTKWMPLNKLPLRMDGLHMDEIYDNFIRQVAGERLFDKGNNKPGAQANIKDAIDRDNMRQKFIKQIAALEAKMKNEKQFSIQVKLNAELKMLKKELEELN